MKKLKFTRQDAHKKVRLGNKWRRPKGLHSKMRLSKKGYNKSVSIGYGSPKKTRNLHASGLKLVIIKSLKELEKIDVKKECIAVAKTIGLKKKVEILKQAVKKSINVVNVKDINKFLKDVEEKIKKSKEEKEKLKKKKELKKKEKEKAGKKKTIDEKVEKTDEEKKEEEKKERDKLLTKKTE
ncbi:MAG: 50S ribosomal protein L32e [Nanoarchaeota archaeon]|nr:50S ribosomal protein L32e [Nanoarchaeota archaeon]MBU4493606.1 50S ribosomal protein L32e [Nanoarchaeota archaeon]